MPEGRPVDRDRFREYLSDEKDDADELIYPDLDKAGLTVSSLYVSNCLHFEPFIGFFK